MLNLIGCLQPRLDTNIKIIAKAPVKKVLNLMKIN